MKIKSVAGIVAGLLVVNLLNAQLGMGGASRKLSKLNEAALKCLDNRGYYSQVLLTAKPFKLYDWIDAQKLEVVDIDTGSNAGKTKCIVSIIKNYPVENCSRESYAKVFGSISSKRIVKGGQNLFIDCDVTKGILTTEFDGENVILAYLPYINDGYRPSGIVDDVDLIINNEKYINYDKMQIDILNKNKDLATKESVSVPDYRSKLMLALKSAGEGQLKKVGADLDKVKIPEPFKVDKEVEAEIFKAFEQAATMKGKAAKKVIITSDWRIVNDDLTGVITGRRIDASICYVQNGRCYICSFVFEQKYEGGGNYQKNMIYTGFSGKAEEMNCGKLAK